MLLSTTSVIQGGTRAKVLLFLSDVEDQECLPCHHLEDMGTAMQNEILPSSAIATLIPPAAKLVPLTSHIDQILCPFVNSWTG